MLQHRTGVRLSNNADCVGIMNPKALLFRGLVFLISLSITPGFAAAEKQTVPFDTAINRVVRIEESLIVAGEGFLASIPAQTFKRSNVTLLKQESGSNFSVLVTDRNSAEFLTCYRNGNRALCIKCSRNRCENPFAPFPSFVLGGSAMFTPTSFSVVTSNNSESNPQRKFFSRWTEPYKDTTVELSVKPDWQYNVLHVCMYDIGKAVYILSEVDQLSVHKRYTAMSEFLFSTNRFKEQFIDSPACGNPVSVVGSITKDSQSGIYFVGKHNKLCLVMWKEFSFGRRPLSDRFNYKGVSDSEILNPSIKRDASEIRGFENTLWTNESITSGLFLDRQNPTPLLLLGTQQGRILKYAFTNYERSYMNASITFKYGMTVSKTPTQVILSTFNDLYLFGHIKNADGKNEVFRNEIHDCGHHDRCDTCFSGDPYCSWFPLEHRCRFGKASEKNQVKKEKLCPKIVSVSPEALPLELPRPVLITINIPTRDLQGQQLFCHFFLPKERTEQTKAAPNSKLDKKVECLSPKLNISSTQEYLDVNVTIFLNDSALVMKNKTMKFYNCRYFKSCVSCHKDHELDGVRYKCAWNEKERRCALESTKGTRAKCPQFEQSESLRLRLPNNVQWNMTLKGSQLQGDGSEYECSVGSWRFPFTIINKTVALCSISAKDFGFSGGEFQKSETLKIISKERNEEIDAKDGKPLAVNIYECANIIDCRTCLLRGQKGYFCTATKANDWKCGLRRNSGNEPFNCGHTPSITDIFPMNGPLEGNTRVTVNGTWLGLNMAQLSGKVLLGEVNCSVSAVTVPLDSFECITQPSNQVSSKTFNIWGKTSGPQFSYKAVSAPSDIKPTFCFTDYPGAFNVTIGNLRVGRSHKLSVAEIDLANLTNVMSDNYTIPCPRRAKATKGKMYVTVDGNIKASNTSFEFLPAPFLKPTTLESIQNGGVWLSFPGSNDLCKYLISASMSVKMSSLRGTKQCELYRDLKSETKSEIRCRSPRCQTSSCQSVDLTLETVPNVNFTRGKRLQIKYFPNPEFLKLKDTLTINKDQIRLMASENSDLTRGARNIDYRVTLGGKPCNITVLDKALLTCSVKGFSEQERKEKVLIIVYIGSNFNHTLGNVRLSEEKSLTLLSLLGLFALFIPVVLFGLFYKRWRDNSQERDRKAREQYMEEERFAAANASRNAFIEMQTAMSDMQLFDTNAELPYRDFEDFVVSVLLPNPAGKAAALAEFEQCSKSDPTALASPDLVLRFNSQLLCEKPFLLTLIRTFDSSTKLADKSLIGAALSVVLVDRMEYYYEVLRELFHHIVKTNVEERKTDSLTLLFRRSESLMEKMFSNWLTICLYSHLRNSDTGKKLYIVFKALSKFLDMGPVDALRCRAKNVLSEDVLLSEEIDFCVITLRGSLKEEEGQLEPVELQVLSCDTIGQVKEKIIEALFPHRPFSMRPAAEDFVLQWQRSTGSDDSNPFFLPIETQLMSGASNKLPVIGDLNAKDALLGAHLVLVRPSQAGNMNVVGSVSSFASEADDSTNLLARDSFGELIHLCEGNTTSNQTGISKDFSLPHLLKTKHVVHTYIEDLFKSIFNIDIMEPPPPYVEHIFGVIDDAINEVPFDREMMSHVWKSNSYILRVWVNLLKNPEFLFDVNKSLVVNANLSVIAQALMDACCYNPKPTARKGLSSTKLVFLRDIEQYRKWVNEFYTKLKTKKTLPSDQDMSMLYNTMQHTCNFNGDLMFRATRFLFMKSRDLKTKILDNIDVTQWLHTQEERQSFKDRVEAILGSTCTDTMV